MVFADVSEVPEHRKEGCSPATVSCAAGPHPAPLTTQPCSALLRALALVLALWVTVDQQIRGPRGSVFSPGTRQPMVVVLCHGRAGNTWRVIPSIPLPSLKARKLTIMVAP